MIVTANLPPEKNLYFLGGKILDLIMASPMDTYDINYIFSEMKNDSNISISLIIYTLDWLFILNLISPNIDGTFSKCF